MSEEDLIALFSRIGIEPSRISATVKNAKFATALADTIREAGCQDSGAEKAVGVLLDGLAGTLPAAVLSFRPFLAKKIAKRDIKSDEQLQGRRVIYSLVLIPCSCCQVCWTAGPGPRRR